MPLISPQLLGFCDELLGSNETSDELEGGGIGATEDEDC
jgi:hypothetical protein